MKTKKLPAKDRNWALVFVACIIIVLGLSLVILAVMNIPTFSWWSLGIGIIGLTAVAASITAIIKNDPTWILLDLIMPF